MPKEIFVAFSIHVDAVAGWLGSYQGEDSPGDISRGVFAAEVGVPRLLRLFERFGLKQSFFIPGHSVESFPREMEAVVRHGHEVGLHGYSHENPLAMSRQQEEDVFDKSIEVLQRLSGQRPTGYVAPWWEVSTNSVEILLDRGIKYDHSLMHRDFTPYYLRVGDGWTPIDYSKAAAEWMTPFVHGTETSLIEIPASWYLDDLPPMMFIKGFPNSHGYVNPRDLGQTWRDTFDWVYREHDYAVFPMTIHPDVSGRPQVLLMLEDLIAYMIRQPGVRFVTLNDMADDFARRSPRAVPA
ncbi:polysaccharide deacetylase [Methylobacterium iners]|jgi:peptidoglycan/xylan/chitin deacetylase (PgdA/CDA1 family)|uniref:polysaccharide deacetylase family protein n=1 Tax=Methylobacterium iners TaxID=418707 RepID=UPI0036107846